MKIIDIIRILINFLHSTNSINMVYFIIIIKLIKKKIQFPSPILL